MYQRISYIVHVAILLWILTSFATFISKGRLLEILIITIYILCVIIIGENFTEHWLHFTLWYWVIYPFTPINTRSLITLIRCKFSNFIFRSLFYFFLIRNDHILCKEWIQALTIHCVLPFMIRTCTFCQHHLLDKVMMLASLSYHDSVAFLSAEIVIKQ